MFRTATAAVLVFVAAVAFTPQTNAAAVETVSVSVQTNAGVGGAFAE